MIKNEKLGLATLLLISILLSIYLYFKTYIISIDGAFQYIPLAKDFASGLFRKALSHNQQPLYSLMLAFVSRWVHDFETAGKLVSSLFGVLVVFPVYFLGKRIFDEKVAFISAFLLILHPYFREFSADVLKESTYLFFMPPLSGLRGGPSKMKNEFLSFLFHSFRFWLTWSGPTEWRFCSSSFFIFFLSNISAYQGIKRRFFSSSFFR